MITPMKKRITLLAMLFMSLGIVVAQQGEIMNGDFEDWSTVTIYDYPDQWESSNTDEWRGVAAVEKSTDASDGSFATKLVSVLTPDGNDTLIGYVFHGTTGSQGPDGGVAYTSTFDEVTFDYKASLSTGDTMFIFMIRFNAGSMVEMNAIPVVYTDQTSWTSKSINVSSTPQDELFFGFVFGDPENGNGATPGSWVEVDNVKLKNGGTAVTDLPDHSFESWASQAYDGPDNWYSMNDILSGVGAENCNISTDAHTGTYAVELSTDTISLFGGDTIPGFISLGPINMMGGGGSPFLPMAYDANPTNFSGAYKYTPSNGDQGIIYLEFYNNSTVVGQHVEYLNATSGYQTFNATLTLSMTPDSVLLVAGSGDNPGSVLLLDNFSFSGGNVSVFENNELEIELFPNPASDYFVMNIQEEYAYEIYSIDGKRVGNVTGLQGWETVDVNHLSSGKYIMKIMTKTKTVNRVLIVE